jgi:hypothetical protein
MNAGTKKPHAVTGSYSNDKNRTYSIKKIKR